MTVPSARMADSSYFYSKLSSKTGDVEAKTLVTGARKAPGSLQRTSLTNCSRGRRTFCRFTSQSPSGWR